MISTSDSLATGLFTGQFSERKRFDRRTDVIVAHGFGRHATCIGDHFSHGQPAQATLTWAHAASAEGLRLVRPEAAELHKTPQFARSHLFAAAHDHLVLRHTIFIARTIKTRSEEHTSELQSLRHLVCRLLLE